MSCFACFFRLLLLVALIKNQFGRYLLVQVEETKKIHTPQFIPQIEVDEEKKIDIPQVIPQVEGDEEEKIDIPLPQTRGNNEFKDVYLFNIFNCFTSFNTFIAIYSSNLITFKTSFRLQDFKMVLLLVQSLCQLNGWKNLSSKLSRKSCCLKEAKNWNSFLILNLQMRFLREVTLELKHMPWSLVT